MYCICNGGGGILPSLPGRCHCRTKNEDKRIKVSVVIMQFASDTPPSQGAGQIKEKEKSLGCNKQLDNRQLLFCQFPQISALGCLESAQQQTPPQKKKTWKVKRTRSQGLTLPQDKGDSRSFQSFWNKITSAEEHVLPSVLESGCLSPESFLKEKKKKKKLCSLKSIAKTLKGQDSTHRTLYWLILTINSTGS